MSLDDKLNMDRTAVDNNVVTGGANATLVQVVPKNFHVDPVYKWNFRFSGSKGSLSVNAFLQQVEEYRVARGVSK